LPLRSWAERAPARLAALLAAAGTFAMAGCDASGEPDAQAKLTVYVSAPLSGSQARTGLALAEGVRQALAEAGGEAGGVKVDAVTIDSGPGASAAGPQGGAPDPVRAAANARDATEDSSAIAYLGELDSATTRTSLPITNDARMLQISPTAGASYLLAPFEGSDEVPPETQPTGERTFGTLAPLAAKADPGELGRGAMALVLDAIDRADDPLDRASVVDAFFEPGARESPLGTYEVSELGEVEPPA
jgi:hypothetical protein